MISSYENAYTLAFAKIFKSFDKTVVGQCQYFMGQLPVELKIINKQIIFFASLVKSSNGLVKFLSKSNEDYLTVCNCYNLAASCCNVSKLYVKTGLWAFFAHKIGF